MHNGVVSSFFGVLIFELLAIKIFSIVMNPPFAAIYTGVDPSFVGWSTFVSAYLSSILTTSLWLFMIANISAVSPVSFQAVFTVIMPSSVSSNCSTISVSPSLEAVINVDNTSELKLIPANCRC